MQFRVTQHYNNASKVYTYFDIEGVPHLDLIERMAIKLVKDDWEKANSISLPFSITAPRPIIEVAEFKDGKKVKGGIQFKTKWRITNPKKKIEFSGKAELSNVTTLLPSDGFMQKHKWKSKGSLKCELNEALAHKDLSRKDLIFLIELVKIHL